MRCLCKASWTERLVVIRGSQPNRVRERRELGDALNGKIAILNGKDE